MPVVHIQTASPPTGEDATRALGAVAEAVARGASCPVEDVWCTLGALDAFTIGERPVTGAGRIVFVEIQMRARGATVTRFVLENAAEAVSGTFGVPLEDVWARVVEVRSGETFAGGAVVGTTEVV
jgi:hypothetical protein